MKFGSSFSLWLGAAVTSSSRTALAFAPAGMFGARHNHQYRARSSHRALQMSESSPPHDITNDEFTVGILGDLHMDPRKMEDYVAGRTHWVPILQSAVAAQNGNVALVSLGDLGESKSVRPEETSELFAGTTECHELAAEYLGSFGVPYEVVGGNHGACVLDEYKIVTGRTVIDCV